MAGKRARHAGEGMTTLTITAVVNTAILDSIIAGLVPNTDAAVEATALAIQADVKMNIIQKDIIDTSNLLNSISSDKLGQMLYEVTDGTDYGIYPELGTRRGIVARPFFIPAVEKNAAVLADNIAKAIIK
jgi:hypothetical protein